MSVLKRSGIWRALNILVDIKTHTTLSCFHCFSKLATVDSMQHNSKRQKKPPAASRLQTMCWQASYQLYITRMAHLQSISGIFPDFLFSLKVCCSFTQFDQNMKTSSEICIFSKAKLNLFILFFVTYSSNLLIISINCQDDHILSLPRRQVALFIFGDSLFDAGINNYINTTTDYQANFWPYGESLFDYPTGRFSDGRLIPDFIGIYACIWDDNVYLQC